MKNEEFGHSNSSFFVLLPSPWEMGWGEAL